MEKRTPVVLSLMFIVLLAALSPWSMPVNSHVAAPAPWGMNR